MDLLDETIDRLSPEEIQEIIPESSVARQFLKRLPEIAPVLRIALRMALKQRGHPAVLSGCP